MLLSKRSLSLRVYKRWTGPKSSVRTRPPIPTRSATAKN